jgi:hypothetical protein
MTTTRYVLTYINKDGMRTLMQGAQGRYTYATEAAAQEHLDTILANTSADTLRQIYGADPKPQVRPCECYDGHFDPVGIYFPE